MTKDRAEDSASYRRSEDGIDKRCRSGLIRQRIPMSIAPLVCHLCKKSKSPHSGMIAELIRPSLLEFIKKKVPDLGNKAFICFEDLGEFRNDYVKEVLEDEIGELSALDQEVIESLVSFASNALRGIAVGDTGTILWTANGGAPSPTPTPTGTVTPTTTPSATPSATPRPTTVARPPPTPAPRP